MILFSLILQRFWDFIKQGLGGMIGLFFVTIINWFIVPPLSRIMGSRFASQFQFATAITGVVYGSQNLKDVFGGVVDKFNQGLMGVGGGGGGNSSSE